MDRLTVSYTQHGSSQLHLYIAQVTWTIFCWNAPRELERVEAILWLFCFGGGGIGVIFLKHKSWLVWLSQGLRSWEPHLMQFPGSDLGAEAISPFCGRCSEFQSRWPLISPVGYLNTWWLKPDFLSGSVVYSTCRSSIALAALVCFNGKADPQGFLST